MKSEKPKPNTYYSIKKILPVIVVVFFSYSLLTFINEFEKIIEIFKVLLPEIIIGLILVLIGYLIRFYRWRLMMRLLGQNLEIINDAQIWMASFAFTATPGKSGELVRSFLLKERFDIPLGQSISALLVERMTDATAVFFLLAINSFFIFENNKEFFLLFCFGILILIFSLFFLSNKNIMYFIIKIFTRKISNKFYNSGIESINVLHKLLTSKIIIFGTLLGSLAWALEGLSLWILLQKMEQTQVSLGYAIVSQTSSGLIGALSMLPGGLGATETSIIGLLSLKDVDLGLAYSLTLLIRLMTLWFATLLGVICFWIIKKKNGISGKIKKKQNNKS